MAEKMMICPICEGSGYLQRTLKHCDVHTLSGDYCPNMPTKPYMLEGKPINLCNQCYKNCIDGAFGAGLYLNLKPASVQKELNTRRSLNPHQGYGRGKGVGRWLILSSVKLNGQ